MVRRRTRVPSTLQRRQSREQGLPGCQSERKPAGTPNTARKVRRSSSSFLQLLRTECGLCGGHDLEWLSGADAGDSYSSKGRTGVRRGHRSEKVSIDLHLRRTHGQHTTTSGTMIRLRGVISKVIPLACRVGAIHMRTLTMRRRWRTAPGVSRQCLTCFSIRASSGKSASVLRATGSKTELHFGVPRAKQPGRERLGTIPRSDKRKISRRLPRVPFRIPTQ